MDAAQSIKSEEEKLVVEIETRSGGSFANFICPACSRRMSIDLGLLLRSQSIGCLCGSAAFELSESGEVVASRGA